MTLMLDWFDVREAEPGIFIIEEPLHVERVKSYLVVGDDRAALIDTGMGVANIREVVGTLTDKPVTVLLSHAHWDHVGGNSLFDRILIHPAEADELLGGFSNDRLRKWFAPEQLTGPLPAGVSVETMVIPPSEATGSLVHGQVVDLGGRQLEVLHCPGHSPGGVVFLDRANRVLFSTDLAYRGFLYAYQGRSLDIYLDSLRRLAGLAPDVSVVYPSHNESPLEPDVLVASADILQQVVDGAEPAGREGDVAGYMGDQHVGVYLFPARYED
jgi:glyoxylase-like metal-dependent hydrolase (beta-lactamase superfamily II)